MIALVAVVLSTMPLHQSTHPLAAFSVAPLPAVIGAWIDWSRIEESVPGAAPFRTERRSRASAVLGVSSSPGNLEQTLRSRARAWTLYLMLLAASASVLAAAASYEPAPDCQVRSVRMKPS